MSFFRKAFHKISNAPDSGTVKQSPSTTALPALSFQHDFGEALWDGRAPEPTLVPIRIYNSNSSISPSSRISLADKDSGFKSDDSTPLPPPKFTLPGSYKEASFTPTMALPKIDGDLPRHRTPKKHSTSSFPFLANLAGLKISLDKDDTQDYSEPSLSPSLSIVNLSSNASTPIDNFPPPLPRVQGRSRWKRQNITTVVQSLAGPAYLSYNNSQVDASTTERLEEAAKQARLNAASTTETPGPVSILPEGAVSCSEDDEGHSFRVEAKFDKEPGPYDAFIRPLEDNENNPPPPPFPDEPFPWDKPLAVEPNLYSNAYSTLDGYLNGTLENLDSKEGDIHPQTLKDDNAEPTMESNAETRVAEFGFFHDYSCSLIDDYAVPPTTTPPPIPTSGRISPARLLEEEVRLLRSRLAESKSQIDELAEEKLRAMQSHHLEVLRLSESLQTLEQKEFGYLTQIQGLFSENQRLKVDRDDVVLQLKYQIEEYENLEKANKELQKDSLAFCEYKLKMQDKEIKFEQLFKEKDSWQDQIDNMQQSLSDAERRVRCLDIITRRKYEAKQDGAYGSGSAVGRSTKLHFSPHVKGPSMDVINSVRTFNEEVLQAASYIVEHLEEMQSNSALLAPKELTRAKEVWGSKIVTMLQQQARPNDLLLQNCLEVFITHWCVLIAEGWYPKHPSFSDILVELTAHSPNRSYNGLGNFRLNTPL